MPGPHRKMVTQEESATVIEGRGCERSGSIRERWARRRGACRVRQVVAASDGDRIREPNGGPMLPEELRPAPCECVYPRLIIPEAV